MKGKSKSGYTKQQFLNSKKFTPVQKDILNVLLEDGNTYTTDQVVKMIEEFKRKEVK